MSEAANKQLVLEYVESFNRGDMEALRRLFAPDAQIYIVRQKDDGTAVVTFGDGVNGAALQTGAGNVVVSYRFGAGAAAPPAGSITKIAKPAAGLRGVINPLAASGGADAEKTEDIRALAPKSALLLGRAVSIEEMEAAAAATPGTGSTPASPARARRRRPRASRGRRGSPAARQGLRRPPAPPRARRSR